MTELDELRAGWAQDDWERPRPALARQDLITGVCVALVTSVTLELMRSFADFTDGRPVWWQYLSIVTISLLLVWRRRFPLVVASLSFVHFYLTQTKIPELGFQGLYQYVVYFGFYSGVAWARDRRATRAVMAGICLAMALWVAWDLAVGSGLDYFRRSQADYQPHGLLPPLTAVVLFTALINALCLGVSIALGQAAWLQARDRARLSEQAATITAQAAELRDQAVVDERLRIARELHDVVAHHVSVMGIQAAGARRLIDRDPPRAAEALGEVEQSSRQAVTQMRALLGTLRGAKESSGTGDRGPQPTLAELPQLLDELQDDQFSVRLDLVEEPVGAAAGLPLPVQLSLYRTVQEALTNVRRHSTARSADVVLRVQREPGQPGHAEVEVLDDGRPRGGTSGSGLGLLGMRERITSHGGTSEIGPRVTGGYRVRVRFPLPAETPQTDLGWKPRGTSGTIDQ